MCRLVESGTHNERMLSICSLRTVPSQPGWSQWVVAFEWTSRCGVLHWVNSQWSAACRQALYHDADARLKDEANERNYRCGTPEPLTCRAAGADEQRSLHAVGQQSRQRQPISRSDAGAHHQQPVQLQQSRYLLHISCECNENEACSEGLSEGAGH